jgi:hypothetical protein
LATAAAIIAVVAQCVAYLVVYNYLRPFGVTPEMLGITPLGAALQMRETTLSVVYLTSAILSIGPAVVMMLLFLFRHIQIRRWHEQNRAARQSKLLGTDDSTNSTDPVRLMHPDHRFTPIAKKSLVLFTVLAMLMIIFLGAMRKAEQAADLGFDIYENGDKQKAINVVLNDLEARIVVVHWKNKDAKPRVVNPGKEDDDIALLIIATESKYLLRFFTERRPIVVVASNDVTLYNLTS